MRIFRLVMFVFLATAAVSFSAEEAPLKSLNTKEGYLLEKDGRSSILVFVDIINPATNNNCSCIISWEFEKGRLKEDVVTNKTPKKINGYSVKCNVFKNVETFSPTDVCKGTLDVRSSN